MEPGASPMNMNSHGDRTLTWDVVGTYERVN